MRNKLLKKELWGLFLTITFITNFSFAQQVKTYSGEKTVRFQGVIGGTLNCKESYSYYVGDDGGYVKSGKYTLNGTTSRITGSVAATYSVTATYKDGILNGPITAKLTVKGQGDWNYTYRQYDKYDVERTLSGSFKDGVPDGQWTYTEKGLMDNDNSTYRTTFSCKNGTFVGDFNCNFSDLKFPKHQQGKFDEEGNLLSLVIQGGGPGKNAGVGVEDIGTKEYHLNSNGDLLTYYHRDKNNKSVENYRCDENSLKEYEQQSKSIKNALEENGYYLKKENTTKEIKYSSYKFGTATIVDYIYKQLFLKAYLDGFRSANGLYSNFSVNMCKFTQEPVEPFTDSDLLDLNSGIKTHLEGNFDTYCLKPDTDVVSKVTEKFIRKDNELYFVLLRDKNGYTEHFFEENQYVQIEKGILKIWTDIKNDIVKEEVEKYLDEVKSWPDDITQVMQYYNDYNVGIWMVIKPRYDLYPYHDKGKVVVSQAIDKFKKFHKVTSYKIDTVYFTDRWYYVAIASITINKSTTYGYQTYKTEAFVDIGEFYAKHKVELEWEKSFEKAERISNICDTLKEWTDQLYTILSEKYADDTKSEKALVQKIANDKTYQNYRSEVDKPKTEEANTAAWNAYCLKMIPITEDYIEFLKLAQTIETKTKEIGSIQDKEVADIVESYRNVCKAWSMDVEEKGRIKEEIKRIEKYKTTQDSCLTFIELRKTITQNNAKIAGYSKTAPTIIKVYNSWVNGVDFTWNQESGRNQAIREFIDTQNKLINVLSKPNISEIDKTVKKSKAKTWEEVKKIVL